MSQSLSTPVIPHHQTTDLFPELAKSSFSSLSCCFRGLKRNSIKQPAKGAKEEASQHPGARSLAVHSASRGSRLYASLYI